MEGIHQSLIDTFREESVELLTELEAALLELEEKPEDMELVDRVFRALHTLKGNGAMFGFDAISTFTHDIESVYDLVREGRLAVTKNLIDLTFSSRDILWAMLLNREDKDNAVQRSAETLTGSFRIMAGALTQGAGTPYPKKAGVDDGKDQSATTRRRTYRIRFRPIPKIFATGTNIPALLDELTTMGPCRIIAQSGEIPSLKELIPEECYLSWDIILTTDQGTQAIRDVFIFVEDRCSLQIDLIDEEGQYDGNEDYKNIGEILIERGDLSPEDLTRILAERKPLGEELVENRLIESAEIESALVEQQVVREARARRNKVEMVSSIRVASEKLDTLVDLVGELVTVQARLSQSALAGDDPEMSAIAEQIEMLTWELRDSAFAIRMIPIGTTFSRFRRLVRDLSAESGKEVELVTEGAEIELDKTVMEKLTDPLVHLIRNAIDHGIEVPEVREAAGKPGRGVITLSASQSGADVLVRVADDGRGLDEAAIREKAVRKGLIAHDADISKREVSALIFTPAFSTANEVTSVSGRGVGLDVVKRSVDAVRGSVQVDSDIGTGTTVTIRLPLTLAIIEGLQVAIGEDRYILPLSAVEECVELNGNSRAFADRRKMVEVRGEIIPYIRLREWFQMDKDGSGDRPDKEKVVITNNGQQRVGFVVDSIIGEHQTVIKSLGRVYRHIEGISGATILGDGSVALILDVPRLVRTHDVAGKDQGTDDSEGKGVEGSK